VEPAASLNAATPRWFPVEALSVLLIVSFRSRQYGLGVRGLRHLFRLLIDPISDVGTIPAQFLQKLDNFGDFAFTEQRQLERQDFAAGIEFVLMLLGGENERNDEQRDQVHGALQPGECGPIQGAPAEGDGDEVGPDPNTYPHCQESNEVRAGDDR